MSISRFYMGRIQKVQIFQHEKHNVTNTKNTKTMAKNSGAYRRGNAPKDSNSGASTNQRSALNEPLHQATGQTEADLNVSDSSGSSRDTANKKKLTEESSRLSLEQIHISRKAQLRLALCLLVMAGVCYFAFIGYLETRVNTPYDAIQPIQLRESTSDRERYWGSYRPQNYFGLRTRDPHSLLTGLMWYTPSNLDIGGKGLRHWCDSADDLETYGWTQHDGRSFGVQEIRDRPFELKTSFVKFETTTEYGGDWTARIAVKNISRTHDRQISLIWYVYLDPLSEGHIRYVSDEKSVSPGVFGSTSGLGPFKMAFHPVKGRVLHKTYLTTTTLAVDRLKETVFSHFRLFPKKNGNRFIGLPGEMIKRNGQPAESPNFIAIQFTAEVDFTLDITYQSMTDLPDLPKPRIKRDYIKALQEKITEFDTRFEKTFHLQAKGFDAEKIKFAKYALSNLIGGIGYFYGASRVQSAYTKNPVPYTKSSLYTAVPSRSFFPRGFLWDEGFHGLLISSWDLDIELDIITHWFNLINTEGWIPREQILGDEALARVPEEFITQHNTNANPPTFFLTLRKIIHNLKRETTPEQFKKIQKLYPRLKLWYKWYNTTQTGHGRGAYRWRGRDAKSVRELNPKTLTSGLDDYPRASHPSEDEMHIDLRCWMTYASGVMAELSIGLSENGHPYYDTAKFLADNNNLNDLYVSPITKTYADYGLHSDDVVLKRPAIKPISNAQKYQQQYQQQAEMVRVTLKEPTYQFVDSAFGYVSLFPFLLNIIEQDSPYLGTMLDNIRDPAVLWTNYGLRSLSKKSPLYMKHNTEHDPPYWRGPIWININFLTLRSLWHYGQFDGPYAARMKEIYSELRENLITNIYNEYKRTGYIWEQYDDSSGQGRGCKPFTGWSSLVVLMMAEQF